MKALFIIHCQDPIYGASRSIGNLIRSLDADVDIIFPFKVKNDGITPEQITQFYGPRVKNVWFLPQPERLTIQEDELALQHKVKSAVKELLYRLLKRRYEQIYREGNYDFIHLNSVTLYSMLDKRWPMFLHVREPIAQKRNWIHRNFVPYMNRAKGVFFIGEELFNYCPPLEVPSLVLVNPYDQSAVEAVNVAAARKRFGLQGTETVYAIIGNIFPVKGVDFVIEAFRAAKLENAVLLVVGRDTNNDGYEEKVRKVADGDPRVRFVGEVSDVETVYRVTDYVVRGDDTEGAGRTVFESLFSGGGVILMGSREKNLKPLELPPELEQNVYFYPVRNEQKLTEVFEETNGKRFEDRVYRTNVPEYTKAFLEFIQKNK